MGSQVLIAGSNNISWLHWDNSSVGVGHKSKEPSAIWVSSSIGSWGIWEPMGSKVLCLGSLDCWFVNRDKGSVDVANQGTGIWVGSIAVGSSIGVGTKSWDCCSMGSKVSNLSSSDLWGLGWGNGTVGVGHQLGAGSSSRGEESQEFHVCDWNASSASVQ